VNIREADLIGRAAAAAWPAVALVGSYELMSEYTTAPTEFSEQR